MRLNFEGCSGMSLTNDGIRARTFGKEARFFLRGLKVRSKEELIIRINIWFMQVNEEPVVYRGGWKISNQHLLN